MFDIGVDIESIDRFEKYSLSRDSKFLNRIYTKNELDYCFSHKSPAKHLAARFCAKEAFYKACNGLVNHISFREIEVLNNKEGKPYFNIVKFPDINVKLSLSHNRDNAIAFVVIQSI